MKRWVALLRAVNLAGRNKVSMSDLRDLLGDLGFEEPRSLLQSGNLVFGAERKSGARLEDVLQEGIRDRLGLETRVFVRDAAELGALIAANPFPDEAASDPGRLLVVFLEGAPAGARVSALVDAVRGPEIVRSGATDHRHLYIHYPDGVGRSRLTSALIERKLEMRGTGRNWNTVLKLAALVGA